MHHFNTSMVICKPRHIQKPLVWWRLDIMNSKRGTNISINGPQWSTLCSNPDLLTYSVLQAFLEERPFLQCVLQTDNRSYHTLQAAPPLMMDLTKMPRSAWFSLERFPLTLTPSPAEPESLRGISKVRNSLVPSGVRTRSSSSVFFRRGEREKEWHTYILEFSK